MWTFAFLLFSCYFILGMAANISGISFSDLTITAVPGSQSYPHQGWWAKFRYSIPDTTDVKAGDYFTLTMPEVYKIKFDNTQTSFKVSLGSDPIFECYASKQAAYLHEETVMQCDVLTDLSGYESISGEIQITLVFSDGSSIYQYELQHASTFTDGLHTVNIGDMTAEIDVSAADYTDGFYYSGRTTTYNSLELYYLGFNCPNGHVLSAKQTMQYDKNFKIDCDSGQFYQSKNFNDWLFPFDKHNLDGSMECNDNLVEISVGEMEEGSRIWANVLQSVGVETATISNTILFDYTCTDTVAGRQYTTTTRHTPVVVITEGVFTGIATAPERSATTTVITSCSGGCQGGTTSIPISATETPARATITVTEPCTGIHTTVSGTDDTDTVHVVPTCIKQTSNSSTIYPSISVTTISETNIVETTSNTTSIEVPTPVPSVETNTSSSTSVGSITISTPPGTIEPKKSTNSGTVSESTILSSQRVQDSSTTSHIEPTTATENSTYSSSSSEEITKLSSSTSNITTTQFSSPQSYSSAPSITNSSTAISTTPIVSSFTPTVTFIYSSISVHTFEGGAVGKLVFNNIRLGGFALLQYLLL
ncbi:Sag1p Ecym_4780 [Eremothecium cymbalariae DBVPG|uniref:Agglutinin-like protein N-terminal domain-containing protein n=1 Tax=Eremothecium cymbalariae (strain CBS 270.75 / DBVPG 7215 / KCTC 17166 / NRRL Y-17582) TaxID=931890 RepID=G8JSS0_ERECY|nr:hypothetical protein Ecym_4780 [Eremothecium cymbalariae DBVPG\